MKTVANLKTTDVKHAQKISVNKISGGSEYEEEQHDVFLVSKW